ncbi:RNA polymerase sigma-70 factor (ECF subfamily) [Fontibacillus phaseoli]|uniref:RNA polymerase sigma-70 factor (ECF subfamily) n=1 Tax=Fontibacillus phaseoli TaxID=1416533 RepID=A0A369BBD6_9BACL|nr:sigma-70 family RNA polymerase sigma factor [Fontibacillus phaseoli]RCX18655.1 RNA polymerase sigma-70 factor (ECF subfamily) [Fontibacillus phaseoli]
MSAVRQIKQAKKGNKEALLQLILADKDAYYRLALTYMGNEHDAMDAMEEMIVLLYERIHQLRDVDAFYSWSKTILVNICKALLRKRQKLVLLEDLQAADGADSSSHSLTNDPYKISDQQMHLQELLQQLSEPQKEVIQLKYFHDLDYATIADLTEVPVGTVKSRVFQGLKKLRELYGRDVDE